MTLYSNPKVFRALRSAFFRQIIISMSNNNNPVSVSYTDAELRNLVEEYITQQKEEFALKHVCSYILYWAVEDGKVAEAKSLIESNELYPNDQERVKGVLGTIVADGRIEDRLYEKYTKKLNYQYKSH